MEHGDYAGDWVWFSQTNSDKVKCFRFLYIYISYRCFLSKDTSFIAVQFYGNFQISGDMNYLLE